MRLDRVLADVETVRDLSIAQPRGDELQDLEFAWGDPELRLPSSVPDERLRWNKDFDRHRHFLHNDRVAG